MIEFIGSVDPIIWSALITTCGVTLTAFFGQRYAHKTVRSQVAAEFQRAELTTRQRNLDLQSDLDRETAEAVSVLFGDFLQELHRIPEREIDWYFYIHWDDNETHLRVNVGRTALKSSIFDFRNNVVTLASLLGQYEHLARIAGRTELAQVEHMLNLGITMCWDYYRSGDIEDARIEWGLLIDQAKELSREITE